MDMVTSSKPAFFHYTPGASHPQVKNEAMTRHFRGISNFVIWVKQAVLSSQKYKNFHQKFR
jgi:hypothetical protein